MDNNFTQDFFNWIENSEKDVKLVAADLNKEAQTVYNWRSKGIPKGQIFACQALMDKAKITKIESLRNHLVLRPTPEQFKRWNQASVDKGEIMEKWAMEGLDALADKHFTPKLSHVAEDEGEYNKSNIIDPDVLENNSDGDSATAAE